MSPLLGLSAAVTGVGIGATLIVGGGALALLAVSPPPEAAGGATEVASSEAIEDIPPALLPIFVHEAAACPGLSWTVLAAVSRVESNHGRYAGAQLTAAGAVDPPIIGIALDGTNGTARIPDSDSGQWDGDPVWDRAVGPFQFIPSSWRIFGGDANGDGIADPNNIFDALPAMRRHLCPEGKVTDVVGAIRSYNHSDEYVAEVLDWASRYTAAPKSGGYALPVPLGSLSEADLNAAHHDYPAVDLRVPVGTPVLAITSGVVHEAATAGTYPTDPNRCGSTVIINGDDGATYIYCHLSAVGVKPGQRVVAADPLGTSGGALGAPGAGNTTGPHLHLGLEVNGQAVCPQPLLLSIMAGAPLTLDRGVSSTSCIEETP